MQIKANGIDVEMEEAGPADGPVLLLVNGYGSQLLNWPDGFLEGLVDAGYRVIRYDNRDVGLSQKFSGAPSAKEVAATVRSGGIPSLPYTLSDMAADGIGVLDTLGIGKAHVLGVSMGGMLAQLMAIEHGDRLLSLTSIMSTTGNPEVPPATDAALAALTTPAPSEARADVIAHSIKGRRTYESPAYPKSDEELTELIGEAYDRMFYPEGTVRQYAAILGDGSRVDRLQTVRTPTLVIHGRSDNLVRVEGGIDTAKHVPGATLQMIEGMGHDLPDALCPKFVELVREHARRAVAQEAAE